MLTSESQFLGSHLVVEIERSRVEWKVPPRRFTESDCGAGGDSDWKILKKCRKLKTGKKIEKIPEESVLFPFPVSSHTVFIFFSDFSFTCFYGT
jgi:hypothetical protein